MKQVLVIYLTLSLIGFGYLVGYVVEDIATVHELSFLFWGVFIIHVSSLLGLYLLKGDD